jgi:hypothetical protein
VQSGAGRPCVSAGQLDILVSAEKFEIVLLLKKRESAGWLRE